MKKSLIALGLLAFTAAANAQTEQSVQLEPQFSSKVLTTNLNAPWEMLWGPDNFLWVTERQGKSIDRINPETGENIR